MSGARLRDVLDALEAAYPPALAESWDAVGLVCGDPDEPVSRVLVAVDPVPETVAEAVDTGA
jgi:putative NIF3 family GTP cyclohydrolase 1 type 2